MGVKQLAYIWAFKRYPTQYKHNTSQLVFFMYLFVYSRKIIPLCNYTLLFATFFFIHRLCSAPNIQRFVVICFEFVCVMTARKKTSEKREREKYKNKWIDWKIMWKIIIMWNINQQLFFFCCSPWEKIILDDEKRRRNKWFY